MAERSLFKGDALDLESNLRKHLKSTSHLEDQFCALRKSTLYFQAWRVIMTMEKVVKASLAKGCPQAVVSHDLKVLFTRRKKMLAWLEREHVRNPEAAFRLVSIPKRKRDKWSHPLTCDQCESRFTQIVHLQDHRRTHLMGPPRTPFGCKLCNVKCTTKSNLTVHLRVHTKKKPFECNICGHQTAQLSNLKRHYKKHTLKKKMRCVVCGYKSRNRYDVIRHIKLKHGAYLSKLPAKNLKTKGE